MSSRFRCIRRPAVALVLPCAFAAGCAALGGGRREPLILRTPSVLFTFQPATLDWRVEDPRLPEGKRLLLESRMALDATVNESLPKPSGAGRRAATMLEGAAETALGPARTRTLSMADGLQPSLDLAVAALENRPAVALSVTIRNAGPLPMTVRRFVLAALDETLVAGPDAGVGAPPAPADPPSEGAGGGGPAAEPRSLRLFLHAPLSGGECRVLTAGTGVTHASSGFTAAFDPELPWTLLAGFPTCRQGLGHLQWRIDPARAPGGTPRDAAALRLAAETDFGTHVLEPGEAVATDELLLLWDTAPAAALDAYTAVAGASSRGASDGGPGGSPFPAAGLPIRKPQPFPPLAVWSSWHASYRDVTEEIVLQNLDFAARHLKEAGLTAILVEDGYQRAVGDWETNPRFPHGHRWLTDQIHARGLKAGLWLAPFLVSGKSALFQEHADWMVRDASGQPQADGDTAAWGGRFYILDATVPETRRWLADLCRRVTDEWGYDVVKLDHLEWALHGERSARPMSRVQAYVRALEAVREACGSGRSILGAGAPLGPSYGLFDAMRISPDGGADWNGLQRCAFAAAARQPFHLRVWQNDSDALIVRPPLTDDEARAWANVRAMTGALFLGDPLHRLSPPRAALLQKLLPAHPAAARPIDFFDREHRRGPTLRPADAGQAAAALALPSVWRFKTGDQPHWKDPGVDDADWSSVAVPGNWKESGFPGHDGYAWYRVRFTLPPEWPPAGLVLDLGRVDDVDAAYVNGEPVGTTGRFPPEYEPQAQAVREYAVPARLLRRLDESGAPAENVLAVRVYSQSGPGGIQAGGPLPPPSAWHLPITMGGAPADVLLLVNWTSTPNRFLLPVARLGLDPSMRRLAYDTVEEALLGEVGNTVAAEVRPHASRLILLRPASGRPQVVSTSRHLLPGTVDLADVRWNAETRALGGSSRRLLTSACRIPGTAEPDYALVIHVPPGFALEGATATLPCLAVRAGPELVRVEFPEVPVDSLEWSVHFAPR